MLWSPIDDGVGVHVTLHEDVRDVEQPQKPTTPPTRHRRISLLDIAVCKPPNPTYTLTARYSALRLLADDAARRLARQPTTGAAASPPTLPMPPFPPKLVVHSRAALLKRASQMDAWLCAAVAEPALHALVMEWLSSPAAPALDAVGRPAPATPSHAASPTKAPRRRSRLSSRSRSPSSPRLCPVAEESDADGGVSAAPLASSPVESPAFSHEQPFGSPPALREDVLALSPAGCGAKAESPLTEERGIRQGRTASRFDATMIPVRLGF